jgi:hypothetical protein
MMRAYDDADDLEEQDNYLKDNGIDHENFVARQYREAEKNGE